MIRKLTCNIYWSFLKSLIASIKTLQDVQIMDQIERSGEDIKNGRVRNARDFLKGL